MTLAGSIKLSADQFRALGEDPPGVRLELVNGEIYVSPSPDSDHSYVDCMLRTILNNHIRAHNLGRLYGDLDTSFSTGNVRRPDVLFVASDRLSIVKKSGLEGPPDLCVEILSPSSVSMDRGEKFELYCKNGVANYWIVDPREKTVEAFVLKDGKYSLAAIARHTQTAAFPPFPNLQINLSELWP
jgi:Uma2 family endonuclease